MGLAFVISVQFTEQLRNLRVGEEFCYSIPPIRRVRGAVTLGVKRPEREANHSPPSGAEVENE
jgi:hypothetical protein